jgi:cyclic pyranopterin phosphate synthase
MKYPYGREVSNLRMSVTKDCNLDCFYCHKEGHSGSSYQMSVDEIATILDIAVESDIKSIKITGGEPLMRGDIEDVVREAGTRIKDVKIEINAGD